MGPSRKKSRKNPAKEEDPPQTSTQREAEGSSASTTIDIPAQPDNNSTPKPQADALTSLKEQQNGNKSDASSTKELRSTKSWYGGTWPRLQKSTASTKVARESILAGKPKNAPVTADLSRFDPPRKLSTTSSRPPSMYLGKSKETSSTSDITMGGTFESSKAAELESKSESKLNINHIPKEDTEEVPTQASNLEGPTKTDTSTVERPERPATASGWLGWLGRPDGYKPVNKSEDAQALKPPEPIPAAEEPSAQPQPIPADSPSTTALQKQAAASAPTTSWFGFWSSAEPTPTPSEAPKEQIPIKITQDVPDVTMTDVPQDKPTVQPVAGSSWAFWSSAETTKKDSRASSQEQQTGELAVAGEASQNKPEPAQTKSVMEDKKTKANKRGRPQSVEIDEATRKAAQLNPASTKTNTTPSPAPSKALPPNILIPSVKSTYRMMDNPSVLEQVARLLHLSEQRPVKHVFLSKDPPKIKKALAIGIHGLFPAPLLRTVIGQPTGTSIRFANHAAAALRRWADQHGSATCEIEKVALEGEGKIAERVDNLWKLLLNWIDHVRSADFIMVACHSQGVPVALMLVAKLIEFGVVTSARIGVCAMAGVSLGPFADYKSRLFSGSAGELFEFADPDSVVSKRYEDALRAALNYGVRVTYCGSIDDQLISMESSVFSTVSHPHIYRTVFIDGRIHAPDFIAHLVGFALKLRNLGVSDHGLIRELSAPLAGSLYTGEGHSRLYDDERVYDLALEFALETTSVGNVPLQVKKYEIPTNANPYILPWIMRGLLEEDFVKTELNKETEELLKQFDEWKPATKVLKDVKYRLEAVRSKL